MRTLHRIAAIAALATSAVVGSLLWFGGSLAGALPQAGVVGNGTPGSCTESALTTALAGGGSVTFNCGGPGTITLTSEKVITRPTVIDGGGAITITGNLTTRLFGTLPGSETPLELRNITLDRGSDTGASGGAVRAFGPLTLTGVTIQNSVAITNFCGGGLIIGSDASIANSTFIGNKAHHGGGAICVRAPATRSVVIRDSTFSSNEVTDPLLGFGGALFADLASNVTVVDSAFVFNRGHFGGAGFVGPTATLTLRGTPTSTLFASKLQLNGNSATESGGALYSDGGRLSVDYAVLTVNRVPSQTIGIGYGGAIFNEGVLTLTNSLLSQNEGRFGGAVLVGTGLTGRQSGPIVGTVSGVTIRRNTAGGSGGGLYTNSVSATVTISDTAFAQNRSEVSGGGLARFNAALRVHGSSFTQNVAQNGGGGMLLAAGPLPSSGPYVRIENSTISDNRTGSNLAGGISNGGNAELYSLTIVSNTNGVFSAAGVNTRFRNTVLQNPLSNCAGDASAIISDDGSNYSTDISCVLPGSQTGAGLDPKLGPLVLDAASGTSLHLPLPTSPLINGAQNCAAQDQLGFPRTSPCGIGAIERQVTQVALAKSASGSPVVAGQIFTYTLVISGGNDLVITNGTLSDTLPAGLSLAGPIVVSPTSAAFVGTLPEAAAGISLLPGRTVRVTIPVSVSAGLIQGTVLTNTGVFSSTVLTASLQSTAVVTVTRPRIAVYLPVVTQRFSGGW